MGPRVSHSKVALYKVPGPRRLHCARLFLLLSPLFLHRSQHLRSRRRYSHAMVKEKTAALERAKKATGAAKGKKQQRGSSSRAGLPPG